MTDITLCIDSKLKLTASANSAGRDGDHNWIRFKIKRPSIFEGYMNRAEFRNGAFTSFVFVTDDMFLLPSALAKRGTLCIQLVYTDLTSGVIAKTSVCAVRIGESINAADETNTTFQDGLAQLADSSITSMTYEDNILSLLNTAGEIKAQAVIKSGSSGAGLFAMHIDSDGNLVMTTEEGEASNFSINDEGMLVYTFDTEAAD